MRKSVPAANPDAYVAALTGWRQDCVETLRSAVRSARTMEEQIKWGHLVYLANGPVLLIRAADERVLLGFWRGQRLQELEPRLRAGGNYEMATMEFLEGAAVRPTSVRRLATRAFELNEQFGDPTRVARSPKRARGAT